MGLGFRLIQSSDNNSVIPAFPIWECVQKNLVMACLEMEVVNRLRIKFDYGRERNEDVPGGLAYSLVSAQAQ